VHIHTGQRGATLVGVAHALSAFVTDASGNQVSETTINDLFLDSLRNGDFAINVHQRSIPSIYTACGSIPER